MEDKFYEGFCKTMLWPLFHSSMPTTEDTIASHDADSIEEQREEGQLAYKVRLAWLRLFGRSVFQSRTSTYVPCFVFSTILTSYVCSPGVDTRAFMLPDNPRRNSTPTQIINSPRTGTATSTPEHPAETGDDPELRGRDPGRVQGRRPDLGARLPPHDAAADAP